MSNYVDAGTQTVWVGLMQQSVRPETLFTAPKNTSTPPAELVTDKPQPPAIPHITHSHHGDEQSAHPFTLIERRQGRPGLVARISLPNSEINDEVPLSPPPTHAVLSPLPEANTRHAGHTPLIPRARSPAEEQAEAAVVPAPESPREEGNREEALDEDPELTGSLVLPEKPEDALESHNFSLDALNNKLVKIEHQQRILRGDFSDDEDQGPAMPQEESQESERHHVAPTSLHQTEPSQPAPIQSLSQAALAQHTSLLQSSPAQILPAQSTENELPLSRRESGESRKSGTTEEVDGVILKSPPSNFGAPLGQL